MIAKLSKGGSFSGAVQYIFGPGKGADCLAGMGVLFKDTPSIIRGFKRQAAQNPRVSKPAGHVVLSFSPRDAARLNNRLLLSIAVEYLNRMGIKDTQLIIVHHRDREHPHLHTCRVSCLPKTATRLTVRRSTGNSAIRKSTPHWNGTADRRLLPNANRLRP